MQVKPQLVTDATDGAIVVWQDASSGDVSAQRVSGAGVPQWAANGVPVRNVIGSPRSFTSARAIPDGAGGAIVSWDDFRSGSSNVYLQRLNNAGVPQWTFNGVAVSTAAGGRRAMQIASDSIGGAIVVWGDGRTAATSGEDVYAQRFDAAGILQWPEATVITTAADDQTFPQLVTDSIGGAIVAWQDRRDGNNDIYAQRIGASGRQ